MLDMNCGKRNFYTQIHRQNILPAQPSNKRFLRKPIGAIARMTPVLFIVALGAIVTLYINHNLTTTKFADAEFDYSSVDNDGVVYQGKYSSHVGVVITHIHERGFLESQSSKHLPTGVYKIVRIEIANKQKGPILLDLSTFRLVDDENEEFLPCFAGNSVFSMKNRRVFVKKIEPGATYYGVLAYDVPKETHVTALSFTGGILGEKAELPFQVAAKEEN